MGRSGKPSRKEREMGVKWYTAEEIAAEMKVSPSTVRRMCQGGEITAVRFGRQWRISEDEFLIALGAMVVDAARAENGEEDVEGGGS